jgi:hypothetical protein
MSKYRVLRAVIGSVVGLAITSAHAQSTPQSGLYEIVSGTFSECCGIAGGIRFSLPNSNQNYVKLDVDPVRNLASLAFIRDDGQTVFSFVPCPSGPPIPFSFGFGFISPGWMLFHADPGPPPAGFFWSLTASNWPATLRIDGTVGMALSQCVDFPNRFTYSNVVAVLVPTASIRVSQVEVCWSTATNQVYQVQYRSTLTTNNWLNLSGPRSGDGTTNCVTDDVLPGQPQRFYRVIRVH